MILNSKHPYIPRWIRGILPGLWLLAVCGSDARSRHLPLRTARYRVCNCMALKNDLVPGGPPGKVTNHCISNPGLYWTARIESVQ